MKLLKLNWKFILYFMKFVTGFFIINITHVEDYGHWIPQDPAGKKRESHRILQESTGNSRKWKQYSNRRFFGFFPVDSSQFHVLSSRNRSEIIGKNPKIFRWEYCFHVPAISGAFLPEPARNFRPGREHYESRSTKNCNSY